jgi:hypothetical protein
MKQETRQYFESKRWAYDYMLSQECVPSREKGMPGEIYNLIREEFDPGYVNDTQCPPCAFAIIKDGFRMFDDAVKKEKESKPLIVAATFPKQEPGEYVAYVDMENMDDNVKRILLETPEERKVRLADPNRIIKRRAKRK